MSIQVSSLALGTMDNFIYCVTDVATAHTFVIDPAWDAQAISRHLEDNHWHLKGILLTHSHTDHISAVIDVLEKYPVPVYLSAKEHQLGNTPVTAPTLIADGDYIVLGESQIQVIETPGHTSGSVCFYGQKVLFSGDTLFIDGCGRCDFAESQVDKMWHSIQKIKALPDETVIYPGHHYGQKPYDFLGNQKKTNPYCLIDDIDFFIQFRQHLQSQYRKIPFVPSSKAEMQKIFMAAAGQI